MIAIVPAAPVLSGDSSQETHQLYLTHCVYGEGVLPEAGFVVRACSRQDSLLFRLLSEYPAYEIPVPPDARIKGNELARLALIRLPGGQSILMHSVGLPRAANRMNNFFSHIVWRPRIAFAEAVRSWDSPDWILGGVQDQAKELPSRDSLPQPGYLADDLVTAMISSDGLDRGTNGIRSWRWPDRLGDKGKRRQLVGQFLRGLLRVGHAGPLSARGRLFLLAEPALVALLLYTASRVMPTQLLDDLTFSTYEPKHCLGLYRQAQIVGTWSDDPGSGLDESFFTSRGYAIDTVGGKVSQELLDGPEPLVEEWLRAMENGEWQDLEEINAILTRPTWSAAALHQLYQAARVSRRFKEGSELGRDLQGPVKARERLIASGSTPVSQRNGSGSIDMVRKEPLPELIPEADLLKLKREVTHALQGGMVTEWQGPWLQLISTLRTRPARLAEALPRVLPPLPFPSGLRIQLLRDIEQLHLPPSQQKQVLSQLLKGAEVDELRELSSSNLPVSWMALAICYGLINRDGRQEAERLLLGASEELFEAFWTQVDQVKELNQRRAILAPIISPANGPGEVLLGRLLRARCKIRSETFFALLDELKPFQPEWCNFWRQEPHWTNLLEMMVDHGEESERTWNTLTRLLDGHLLVSDSLQTQQFLGLLQVQDRLGDRFPTACRQILQDWGLLREHFIEASGVESDDRLALREACQRLGLNIEQELKRYFQQFLTSRELNDLQLADFAEFFLSFYPDPRWYEDHAQRMSSWIKVTESCPEPQWRLHYHGYFFNKQVPEPLRERLRTEFQVQGKRLPDLVQNADKTRSVSPVGIGSQGGTIKSGVIPVGSALPGPSSVMRPESLQLMGQEDHSGQWSSAGWLLLSLLGGLLMAFVFGLANLHNRQILALAPFLPLIVSMAEAASHFAVIGATRPVRSPRNLLRLVVPVGCMAIVAGLLGFGAVLIQGLPMPVARWLGLSTVLAMIAGLMGGLAVGQLLRSQPARQQAAGPLARIIAGTAAIILLTQVASRVIPIQ